MTQSKMTEWEGGFHHALRQIEAWLFDNAGPGNQCNGLKLYDDIQRLKVSASLAEYPLGVMSTQCHCGKPVIVHEDRFTRWLCRECDELRCDAPQPGVTYPCTKPAYGVPDPGPYDPEAPGSIRATMAR